MRNIPAIYPTVVFAIIVAGTHTSRPAVVEGLDKFTVFIFGVEKRCGAVEEIAVVGACSQKTLCIVFFSEGLGNARQTPLVVCSAKRDGYRLSFFKAAHIGIRLFLSIGKSGNVTFGMVELVDVVGWSCRPWHKCFLFDCLAAGFIGAECVDCKTFDHCIGYRCHTVVGIHAARVAGKFGECRHPSVTHLVGHFEERMKNRFLAVLIDKYTEGVCGTISVPNPVVGIEGDAIVGMNLPVESTEIAAVFTQTDRALESTVKRCVESLLVFVVAVYSDSAERFVPCCATFVGNRLYVVASDLAFEILFRLLFAYQGDTVAQIYIFYRGLEAECVA